MKWFICSVLLLCVIVDVHAKAGDACSKDSSCGSATLICGDNKKCGEKCSVDTNCTDITEKCLGKIKVCTVTLGLKCANDTGCGTGQLCSDKTCKKKCTAVGNCNAKTERCEGLTSKKVCKATLGKSCSKLPCGSEQLCAADKKCWKKCTNVTQCTPATEICYGLTPAKQVCTEKCTTDTQCNAATEKCKGSTSKKVCTATKNADCKSNKDCGSSQGCRGTPKKTCIASLNQNCTSHAECGISQACDGKKCVVTCSADTDCANGTQTCLTTKGKKFCTGKCEKNYCNNHGKCTIKKSKQTCICDKGYKGSKCENGSPAMQLSLTMCLVVLLTRIFVL